MFHKTVLTVSRVFVAVTRVDKDLLSVSIVVDESPNLGLRMRNLARNTPGQWGAAYI